MKTPRFEDVTETVGIPVTPEAAEMIYTRYRVGADLATGKRVLELGCAAGHGLGLLARHASMVVGGDFSAALLDLGRRHFRGRVPLARLSAEALPFRAASFDLVLFFEATYYVPEVDAAFREVVRVLAPGGQALFVNANPDRPDFIRSPYSVHYHSADEFRSALGALGLSVEIAGAFPIDAAERGRRRVVEAGLSLARRVLEVLGLVPRTLRGRARLKRIAFGHLQELPAEIPDGYAAVASRQPVDHGPVRGFKVVYVTARKGF